MAQDQLGTANLEASGIKGLFRSFFGKIIQAMAMTHFPIESKFRSFLERLRRVNIGKHVFIRKGTILDRVRPDLITIEDYVSLAGRIIVLTHSSPTLPLREILGPESHRIAPVTIKRGAWIAVNVVILPGVTIGECAIVSAGSVVNQDIPPYTVASGIPAKVTKEIYRKKNET